MCLILVAHRAHPAYRLVVAANRDEWFARPTAPAGFWSEAPDVFAGRDLEAHGTWLGITRSGRFAAVTNFRDPASHREGAPSRGGLVRAFLTSTVTPAAYVGALQADAARYNGFSLLVGDAASLLYFSNRAGEARALAPGIYGLANDLLDVPWPKVRTGKARLAAQLNGSVSAERLLELLDDTQAAPDDALPDTGVGLERERQLSPLRIRAGAYGTRASTVLLLSADGEASIVERSFSATGEASGTVRGRFRTTP